MPKNRLVPNSLRFITGFCFILAGLLPLLFYITFTRNATVTSLKTLENVQSRKQLEQVLYLLNNIKEDLLRTVKDYAIWDEMYKQVDAPQESWLDDNLIDWMPHNFGIDSILLLKKNGKIIADYQVFSLYRTAVTEQAEIMKGLGGNAFADLLIVPEGLFIVAVSPVLTSNGTAPINGLLLIAKKITPAFLQNLQNQISGKIALEYAEVRVGFLETDLSLTSFKPLDTTLPKAVAYFPYRTLRPGNDSIVSYTTLTDLNGKSINLTTSSRRDVFLATLSYFDRSITPAVGLAGLLALLLGLFLTRHVIIKPIYKIRSELLEIKNTGKIKFLETKGPVEIKDLIDVFNKMSASLEDNITRAKMLELQAKTDSITGLYGHRFITEYLHNLPLTSQRIALLFCDLDAFKPFNELLGRVAGDNLLKSFAGILSAVVQDKGLAARYGGDEFIVVLFERSDESILITAEEIRKKTQKLIDSVQCKTRFSPLLGISIGIAVYPEDTADIQDLITNANKAVYYAKWMGQKKIQRFSQDLALDIVKSSEERIREEQLIKAIKALATAVDVRDSYTGKHSEAVSSLAFELARQIGLPESECFRIKLAAMIHDLGKIGIPDQILLKNARLSTAEFALIKDHPNLGANILKHLNILEGMEDWVRFHHEHYDGSGYPTAIKGEEIPLGARIISLVDAYHAMLSVRPYRQALSPREITLELIANKGKQFDPGLVDTFLSMINADEKQNGLTCWS